MLSRSTAVYVVQSTEFRELKRLSFLEVKFWFSGSEAVPFWKLGKQFPIVSRSGGNVLISLDPINDQLANFFA